MFTYDAPPLEVINGTSEKMGNMILSRSIGDDISIKSSNVKLNINDICNLISASIDLINKLIKRQLQHFI